MRSFSPLPPTALLLLLLDCWAAVYCVYCLGCAPGCQPLLDAPTFKNEDGGEALLLDGGSCYSCWSTDSTPCLSVPPIYNSTSNITTTWGPSPASAQQPVLDLCNQVQSIWLMQGACVRFRPGLL